MDPSDLSGAVTDNIFFAPHSPEPLLISFRYHEFSILRGVGSYTCLCSNDPYWLDLMSNYNAGKTYEVYIHGLFVVIIVGMMEGPIVR